MNKSEISYIYDAKDMQSAVNSFKHILCNYQQRIEASKQKMYNIYDFKSPKSPYIEFGLTSNKEIVQSVWADTEFKKSLNYAMQDIILNLELLPEFDYIPFIGIKGIQNSGYVASLLGSTIKDHGESGLTIEQFALESVEEIDALIMPDVASNKTMLYMTEHVKFLVDTLGNTVDIVYPQLQGPATNSLRVLEAQEGLMAMLTDPEKMEKLGLLCTKISVEVLKNLFNAAGSDSYFRPRARFYQPPSVKGLLVDDWISTTSPQTYLSIYHSSFAMMKEEIGDMFFHTCGPIYQIVDLLKQLPGVKAMECTFINGQSKTVEELFEVKNKIDGKFVFGSFGTPSGLITQDEQNLTLEKLYALSENGGFAIQAYGNLDDAKKLAQSLF